MPSTRSQPNADDQPPVALLAGGLATRLRPITSRIPKALVEVAGRPFIDWQLDLLRRNGFRKVVLCLGHLGEMVAEHLGDGSRHSLELMYSFDGDRLIGTGGAVRRAMPLLGDVFWVMYGDSYMDIDYRAAWREFQTQQPLGLMTVLRNDNRWDRSNVVYENGRLTRYDKQRPTDDMRYIDYGAALLRSTALEFAPGDDPFDLADLYSRLVAEGKMIGHEVFQRFYEIGTPAGLEQTREYLVSQESPATASHVAEYLSDAARILSQLDQAAIERMVTLLVDLRERGGRLFFLGVGGSAANASHAVNDFRKIAQIESYAPTDNVSELTARTNDEGWETSFAAWLKLSRLSDRDMLFVLSVGGGDLARNVSPNIVRALQFAQTVGAKVCGVVGRDGGYTAATADAVVIVPTVNARTVTPHAEAFQAVIWHLLVSHPKLQMAETKWESTK